MNPLGTRARSEELARLLDGVFGGTVSGGGAAAVAPFAALARRLQSAGSELESAVAPRAEFRAALRTRLVAVASVQAANAPAVAPARSSAFESAVSWTQTRRGQRGLGLAAGAMASVVAVAGVAVAGSLSLPGDPFYSVKRGAEALELRTANGDVAKGSKHLEFAAERLKEVRELSLGRDAAISGSPDQPLAADAFGGSVGKRVRSALADMDRETRTGSALLTAAYRETNNDDPLQILSTFAGRQTRDLQALLPELPASARQQAEASLALVSHVGVEASQLLAVGVCTGQCSPSQASPGLPSGGAPAPQPAPTATVTPPCGCDPTPQPARTADPAPQPQPSPTPATTASAAPSSSSAPASSNPVPLPLPSDSPAPVPLPTPSLPIPLPTLSPSPLSTDLTGLLPLPGLPTG